jgi:ABC-type transport system involved in cytochrome c biogenesis permease subunit
MPLAVPPADRRAEWTPLTEVALFNSALDLGIDKELKLASIEPNQDARLLVTLLESYRDGDVAGFNNAMAAYENRLSRNPPEGTRKLGSEAFFNHAEPFYHATVLYVSAFVLCACSWLGWTRTLSRTAFWLIALTFVLHTTALIARIYISGYPPVTTLYSSAIFIGWGCVLLGLILESIRPIGVGNLIGSVTGFLSLIIAHYLSLDDGDTFKMMQAVLDTRFWLATHVTTITLGYTATYVAGAIAVYYVLRGVFTRTFDAETQREVGRMIYGTLCFALLLSFVGTVLGGLWADDSWGRFWGWDPKENGALIIVLWNALVLHARWGGMVKARGIAVLAIFGNIVTSWSWFGVNQLGIGLHSYGFMESAAFWLIVFVCSQLLIMAVGLIPKHRWRSHNLLDVNGTNGSHDQPLWSRT